MSHINFYDKTWKPIAGIELDQFAILAPLKWKKPQRIFFTKMSDLFHEDVTDEILDNIFAVMALCREHGFQVLTKRPTRMLAYLTGSDICSRIAESAFDLQKDRRLQWAWPLPNVHLGVSVENQAAADERIPLLLKTPAVVRFISAEPLLGSLDLRQVGSAPWPLWGPLEGYCSTHFPLRHCGCRNQMASIDWLIVGGESGPCARPMHPDWVRSLRDQCVAAGVPFFFKGWGEWVPFFNGQGVMTRGGLPAEVPIGLLKTDGQFIRPYCQRDSPGQQMCRVGKKAAGRLLDCREWNEMPS